MNYDPELKLSPHFKYKEMILSSTAIANGIDNNVVEDYIIENAKYVAETLLEPLRKIYGPFSLNSWYRGQDLEYSITRLDGFKTFLMKSNLKVADRQLCLNAVTKHKLLAHLIMHADSDNGSMLALSQWKMYFARKQHPQGEAVDVKIAKAGSVQALYLTCKSLKLPYDQIILEMHKPAIPMSGWVHYSMFDETTERNIELGRKNRYMDFSIS